MHKPGLVYLFVFVLVPLLQDIFFVAGRRNQHQNETDQKVAFRVVETNKKTDMLSILRQVQ